MPNSSKSINFINKNDLLLVSLNKYYKIKDNYIRLQNILKNEAKISLRIIDWFVTNYSKKYNIIYEICKDKKGKLHYLRDSNGLCDKTIIKQFIVYMNYKSQLKAYSKKQFDPFCRRERIEYILENGDKIITTIGQLNFFRWALENKILDYIEKNMEAINNDMNKRNSTSKKKKTTKEKVKTRKKREELSVSASKSIKKEVIEIVVDFK